MSWSRWSTTYSWYIYPDIDGYISAIPMGGPEIRWHPDESFGGFVTKAVDVLGDVYKDEHDRRNMLTVMVDVIFSNHDDVMQWMDKFRGEHKEEEIDNGTGHVVVPYR